MWSVERCGPWIIPAEVWDWEEARAEVSALSRRLLEGQPLLPPPKGASPDPAP
jgi:hypothetical protein